MRNKSRKDRPQRLLSVHKGRPRINLYELIEAVSDEVDPGEDELIPKTIQHMFDSGQARFIDCSTEVCNGQ